MMHLRRKRFLTATLAATAALLPLSTANAQDMQAVERRLGGAVEAGEITLEQAKTMLDALRKSTGKNKANTAKNARAYFRKVQQQITAAVKAGKMSEEDAKAKLEATRKQIAAKTRAGKAGKAKNANKAKQPNANVGRRLRAAVQRGDMTAAEARMKLAELQKKTDKPLAARSKAGKAKAAANKAAAKKKADQRALRQRYAQLQERIEIGVKEGKISREDGEKRLSAARERIAAARKGAAKSNDKKSDPRQLRQRYGEIQKRIEEAVKAGKLSREDAEKELIEIRKEMFGDRKQATRRRDKSNGR